MARIRTVKPDLFRNAELYEAEATANLNRSGPYLNIRFAFVGLLTAADREGRFKWKPRELKLDCLPHDPVEFADILEVLRTSGSPAFVGRYEVEGHSYGVVTGFRAHQRPKFDEARSTIPTPPWEVSDDCPTVVGQSTEGKEGKGKEVEGKESIAQSPADSEPVLLFECAGSVRQWTLTTVKLAEYQESFPGLPVLNECRKALQWIKDNPTRRKTASGMPRFLGSWLGRAQDSGGSHGRGKNGAGRLVGAAATTPGKFDAIDG